MSRQNDAFVEAAARSDADFDGRPWLSMGRVERERYIERSRRSLEPVLAELSKVQRIARDRLRTLKAERKARGDG